MNETEYLLINKHAILEEVDHVKKTKTNLFPLCYPEDILISDSIDPTNLPKNINSLADIINALNKGVFSDNIITSEDIGVALGVADLDANGKLPTAYLPDITSGTTNGTISYKGKEVKVKGLASGAFKDNVLTKDNIGVASGVAGLDANGKLPTTYLPDITTGTENGTISYKGTNIAVKGLASGAFKDNVLTTSDKGVASGVAALDSNGKLPTSYLPDISTGSAKGTISYKGSDVSVKGLGSAAYVESSSFATKAQGEKADSAIQSSDLSGAITTVLKTNFVNKNCVIVSNGDGKFSSSTIPKSKLDYISDLTSSAQKQINAIKTTMENFISNSSTRPSTQGTLWFKPIG